MPSLARVLPQAEREHVPGTGNAFVQPLLQFWASTQITWPCRALISALMADVEVVEYGAPEGSWDDQVWEHLIINVQNEVILA